MIILLSPSKGQDFDTPASTKKYSTPEFLDDSILLVKELQKYNIGELQKLMSISENIAKLNTSRYKSFKTPFTHANAKQAIFAFKGDVYGGIDIDIFEANDLTYAQKHLRILSGLYGCLRPLDLIQPYRLEMKTRLENRRGSNLYQFWGEVITEQLNRDLAKHKTPVLVNLASGEYFKSVKPKMIDGKLLTINFKETKNGKTRVIATFAKRARGMMADFILRNRIDTTAYIKKFSKEGYQFSRGDSDEAQFTFIRPQPE